MIEKGSFYTLSNKINKELGQKVVSVRNFAMSTYFNSVFLKTENAVGLYGKIKATKAMQSFERLHNANCVLDKSSTDYVLKINY